MANSFVLFFFNGVIIIIKVLSELSWSWLFESYFSILIYPFWYILANFFNRAFVWKVIWGEFWQIIGQNCVVNLWVYISELNSIKYKNLRSDMAPFSILHMTHLMRSWLLTIFLAQYPIMKQFKVLHTINNVINTIILHC